MNNIYSDHDSGDEVIIKENPYCFSSCNSGDMHKNDKSITRTRRRKSSSEKGNRICVVCGEKASGFNFDRLTCESCKAFFRRNAMKPKEKMKPCPQGGGCNISGSQRKHCPYCRLEKCFTEGMKKELILPPEKLEQRAKPKRRKVSHSSLNDSTGHGSMMSQSINRCRNPMKIRDNTQSANHRLSRHNSIDSQDYSYNSNSRKLITNSLHGINQHLKSPSPSALATAKEECFTPPPALQMEGAVDIRNFHNNSSTSLSAEEDLSLLATLSSCVAKLKEPFTPQEHPPCDSESTPNTLEEAYNRMDTCIRRIIRLVKLLPAFFQMDKQLQLTLLRTNIYGLIIIYSSFFFEKEIKKLCYPVLSEDGSVRLVTVSVSPSDLGFSDCESIHQKPSIVNPLQAAHSKNSETNDYKSLSASSPINNTTVTPPPTSTDNNNNSSDTLDIESNKINRSGSLKQAVQEDFELYKENTIAAFTELQELTLDDNVLKVLILIIKLFEYDNLPAEILREPVRRTRNRYCGFLMRYLQSKYNNSSNNHNQTRVCDGDELEASSPSPSSSDDEHNTNYHNSNNNSNSSSNNQFALLHFSRMLMSFIDICTLEIRMTEFAKLLSLDGLSPLMREVCSHRTTNLTPVGSNPTHNNSTASPHTPPSAAVCF